MENLLEAAPVAPVAGAAALGGASQASGASGAGGAGETSFTVTHSEGVLEFHVNTRKVVVP